MTSTQKQLHLDQLSWVTRYFLRRLALARRDLNKSEAAAYSSAVFEVTLVTVVMPCLAIFSCVAMTSLKWAPTFAREYPGFSPKIAGLAVAFLVFGIGNIWFRVRLGRHRAVLSLWAYFDSPEDRRVVFWQKVLIVALCGAVVPLLAVVATLWVL